jgi:hypothetical protein
MKQLLILLVLFSASTALGQGTEFYGYACRIDEVATQLGIEAWDGTAKPFIDTNSIQIKAVAGTSSSKTIVCGGTTYWQIGSDNNTNYC